MSKRKADDKVIIPKDNMDIDGEDDSGEDGDDILNVDFEWFDPQPAVDFHGLKTLLRQLFDVDNQLFDLSALTETILAQPLLGSTVKCDGNESDPFAFLTVLNMHQHRELPVMDQLRNYLLQRAGNPGGGDLKTQLDRLLDPRSESQVGLILTERLINMPHQIVPPMYNMLVEEINWANAEKEPYEFSHYLVVSKTYVEVASQLESETLQPPKKKKKAGGDEGPELFYFHPEDEILKKFALASCGYDYAQPSEDGASDAKRAFQDMGVKPQGLLVLLEAKSFEPTVKAIGDYLGSEA